MKRFGHRSQWRGFTLIELLMVIAIIGILAALLLPVITKGKLRARQAQCASNLKQIGVAFHAFAHDHNSRYPMQVRTNDGGTLEFVPLGGNGFYLHFQALSNDLLDVTLLVCPSDRRTAARSFDRLTNVNISYCLSLSSTYDNPSSHLALDGNIAGSLNANIVLWDDNVHRGRGNLLYSDGHVDQLGNGSATLTGGGFLVWPPDVASGAASSGGGGTGSSGNPPPAGGGGGSSAGAQPSLGLFGGLGAAGNAPAAGGSTPGRSGPTPSGPRSPSGGGASSGGGIFSQMENALDSRPYAQPQSTPAPQISKTYTTTRTQDMVAPAIVALAQTNIARANLVMTNKPAPEPAVEAPAGLPDESIAALQGYVEPKEPGYLWPIFLILLLAVLITELMRRHRHRRKRRFVQGYISA